MNLANHPVGLVPSTWLAARLGLPNQAVNKWAFNNNVKCVLNPVEVQTFGRWPSTFSAWVTAWGIDRVLEWLDEYAQTEAAYVRANVDRLHDKARDAAERAEIRRQSHLACITRRNRLLGSDAIREEKREASRKKQARRVAARAAARVAAGLPAESSSVYAEVQRRKREFACAPHPAGLIPDNDIERVTGVGTSTLARYRADHSIAPFVSPVGRRFGSWSGSFRPLIAGWGVDRARTWVSQYMPGSLKAFEHDAAYTAPAPVAAAAPSPSSATGAPSTAVPKRMGEQWRVTMDRQITSEKARKESLERPSGAEPYAETVEQFLARGGRVTRLVGAGSPRVGQVLDVCEFGGVDA